MISIMRIGPTNTWPKKPIEPPKPVLRVVSRGSADECRSGTGEVEVVRPLFKQVAHAPMPNRRAPKERRVSPSPPLPLVQPKEVGRELLAPDIPNGKKKLTATTITKNKNKTIVATKKKKKASVKKVKTKKVRFEGPKKKKKTMMSIPPIVDVLTPDTIRGLWYTRTEIEGLKTAIRSAVFCPMDDGDCCRSGLERFTMERTIDRQRALQFVLEAQRQSKSAEFIRWISVECTRRALDLAMFQGFQDYIQVYDPLQSILAENPNENYNDMLFGSTAT